MMAVSRSLPCLVCRSGTVSNVAGESFPSSITSCSGGELIRGKKLILIQEECVGRDDGFDTTLGEVKSNLNLFGPGVKCTSALKLES